MRPAVPTGLVTFVFSDIEGSTQRWESRREAMESALRRHDNLLRSAFEMHNGRVFKTMGDQFCAVFWSAPEAVAAARHAQRAIAHEDWSAVDGLRVRMAIHTGVTDERDGDYFGPAVNRIARLLAIGHGGQTLLSGFAADLVQKHLPRKCKLLDLGSYRLKDLAHPERVYQLVTPESSQSFPKLRSLGAPKNLPVEMTAFLGREADVAAIRELVGEARLSAIIGAGGVGKTRTALKVAASCLDTFSDGVWLIELAPISDPTLVASAIAAVFGVEDASGNKTLIERVIAELSEKHALLVFDNCEHLIAAAADAVERILRACPNIRILATSREPLRIDGERIYRLPSLPFPSPGRIGAREAMTYAAVKLFVERARASAQDFVLTDANAPFVAEIVWRLDGIALAIELAASRVKVLGIEPLAKGLDERFQLLTDGTRTALPRQQTLRALIGWSYDLLSNAERSLLCQCAIFRGGWSLDAANAVCADDVAPRWDVFELISKLEDKSLVVAKDDGGQRRYRLLESTRQYAMECLEESGAHASVAARHCRYFCELSEVLSGRYWYLNADDYLAQARAELENYRGAIAWGLVGGNDRLSGAIIVANLDALWKDGLAREGQGLIAQSLAAVGASNDQIRARLLMAQANLVIDGGLGLEAATEAVALLEGSTDRVRYAESLRLLGNFTGRVARTTEAAEILERAAALSRSLNVPRLTAATLDWLGFCLAYDGQRARSRRAFDEALALMRAAGDPARMPFLDLAELRFVEGDIAGAVSSAREGLAIHHEVGTRSQIMLGSNNLAAYLAAAGELCESWSLARMSLDIALRLERRMSGAISIQHLAQIAARRGDCEVAARLLGYVDSVYAFEKHPREPTECYGHERMLAILRATYAEGRLRELMAEGAAFSESKAAAIAMAIPAPDADGVLS
ncbi:MAG TPA: adenylate/guanylate cyclase domain-containing protein [Candidatus Dormibacteraeota bacterium]|nr:adenylate/guanylate cyclase domain-containing protein [Candidatus Dormibacteraeota bacterium]